MPDGFRVSALSPVAAPRRDPAIPSERVPGTGGAAARAGKERAIAAAQERVARRKRIDARELTADLAMLLGPPGHLVGQGSALLEAGGTPAHRASVWGPELDQRAQRRGERSWQ